MSDSGEDNAPKGNGAFSLLPEDAERIAASFVPSWEFDEGSFSAGTISSAELDRLSKPVPAAPLVMKAPVFKPLEPEAMTTVDLNPPAMLDRVDPSEPDAMTTVDMRPGGRVARAALDRAVASRQTLLQHGAPPSSHPLPPPAPLPKGMNVPVAKSGRGQTLKMNRPEAGGRGVYGVPQSVPQSGRDPSRFEETKRTSLPRSNRGIIVAAGVGVAVVVGFLGSRALFGAATAAPAPTTVSIPDPGPQKRIDMITLTPPPGPTQPPPAPLPPPPPPAVPEPPPPAAVQTAAPPPAQTAAPAAAEPNRPSPAPPPVVSPVQVSPRSAPVTHPPPVVHTGPKNPPKPSSGGIVRDNPF